MMNSILKQSGTVEITALARASAYLLSRQSPAGGFCFYRTEYLDEPNLDDTYHAVRGLSQLGVEIPDSERLSCLAREGLDRPQPGDLYHAAFTLRTLSPAWQPGMEWIERVRALDVSRPPSADSPALTGWLHRTRTVIRLQRAFTEFEHARHIARAVCELEHPEGGFGVHPNIQDTALALDILGDCQCTDRLRATTGFVARTQTATFGFNTVENSLSSTLESVCAGLHCCTVLHAPVRYGAAALSFILACQTGRGGFARAPGALPDIELTHRGIGALLRLRTHTQTHSLALQNQGEAHDDRRDSR